MRAIAARVGITPTAIYRHFPSREALLERISDDSFDEIIDRCGRFIESQRTFDDQLIPKNRGAD